ncbi:cytochrome-c peroxidase [Mucilaginibacter aquaedulcis]|uniref:cytochrome-c peroxidase n=1 Tax=Mucilaginibacter aquaedulcis TaxID=1187081 RepID=UPI0025B4B8DB|nr:cytochrome c peroxidase [Mucilaginibacter aquaedulcis]MDN3549208.1 cytochrome c peroxidase [Mucilaginibacter aquaedulcis]
MKFKILVIALVLNLVIGITAYELRPSKINYYITAENIYFTVPANFPKPFYSFRNNPITPAGFKLGRILFYDPVLSLDESISCANCHQPIAAFADFGHPVSAGIKHCAGTRNAPGLFNLAWNNSMMWDGRIKDLKISPINAITNPCEMANELNNIASRLQAIPPYPMLFRAAFGKPEVTPANVLNALTQFMAMIVSANSKYDKYIRKEPGGNFTIEEKQGYLLFRQKCSGCHTEPLFTDQSYRNNGLDVHSHDHGRYNSTHDTNDIDKFRVPSLRNIELTAPYMHDGRFATLADVMNHYNTGVMANAHLDIHLQQNGVRGIPLSVDDQNKIISFLKTLTDKELVNDPRFQKP